MPKGIPNKRYTGEFKQMVVETMIREKQEAARQFEVLYDTVVANWERIYLAEDPEELYIERRGRSSKGRPEKYPKAVEEDLLAEVQRLRAENAYLKNCKTWFWKKSDASAKNAGSSRTKANIFFSYIAFNRSIAQSYFLLSLKADE